MTTPGPTPTEDTERSDNNGGRRRITGYERQCRMLLGAFPADFRRDRGDDLVTTLLDDAPAAGGVSIRTAINLVATSTRMRARRAAADRSLGRSMAGGMDLAAVVGLGVQAALAVAVAVFFWRHEPIFYLYLQYTQHHIVYTLPTYGTTTIAHWTGADFRATWIALAALSVGAFVAAVRGRFRPAALLAAVATAYPLFVLAVSVYHQASMSIIMGVTCQTGTMAHARPCPTAVFRAMRFNARYGQFVSTPAVVALTVAATVTVVIAGCRHRHPVSPRSGWWLASAAAVAAVFVAGGDGHRFNTSYPLHGGVMTTLGWLWMAAVVVGLIWSYLDPRVGWATAALSIPFVVYQATAPTFIYLQAPLWYQHRTLLALAAAAIVVLAVNAAITRRRLRHA